YRFLLARPIDEGGRHHYLELMRQGMKLREVAAEIAGSDEFQTRVASCLTEAADPKGIAPQREALVDVHELMTNLDVTQLAQTAEDYYRNTLAFTDRYLAKPLDDPHDVPDLLGSFAHLVGGLRLAPGMRVLDFGAGTCWTTHFLTQLG